MGIQGLLSFVKPASSSVHLSDFKGKTVAIDSYCWIHKGAFGCAMKIGMGEDTDAYVQYCFKFIDMLRSFKITPIMVFDGQNLPAKKGTEERRRESRALAKKKAIECMRLNKHGEARMNFIKSVDVTPEMALKLIKACRRQGIDCVVAPYEADSQLAYLNQKGIVDLVITEDSDLLVFGCKKVLFKLDLTGNATLVEAEKLYMSMDEKPESFTIDKFRHMCILSGCDYLDSLPGVGLKKAMKFIKGNSNIDIYEVLPKIPSSLNLKNLTVSKEYRENFMIADATFRHQLVFDPLQRQLVPLSDPEANGTKLEHCCNAGEMMEHNVAFQLAIGNLSPDDLKVMDNWCPDRDISQHAFRKSIWSKSYKIPQKSSEYKITIEPSIPKTKGSNVVCDVKLLAEIKENDIKTEEKIKRDIEKMYFDEPPQKKICLESGRLSQKENEEQTSPVLNRKRVFVKSRFFCGDKKTEILSPDQNAVNDENSSKSDSESHNNSKNPDKNESKVENNLEPQKLNKSQDDVDSKTTSNESQENSNLKSVSHRKSFTFVKKETMESKTIDVVEKIECEKYNIVECEVRLSQNSISLEKTVVKENIVQKIEKPTVTTRSATCRKPGLSRKNSNNKFAVTKNQSTISMFFKKT